jgi:hypothetical protein
VHDLFPAIVYVLCFLTSSACALLLGRSYRRTGARLLLWSSLCFFFLAANNLMLIFDLLVIPDIANEPRYEPDTDGRAELLASNMAFFVLHRGEQLFGMLQIINREGANGFRESDLAVGGYVANQVTSFLREKRGLRA